MQALNAMKFLKQKMAHLRGIESAHALASSIIVAFAADHSIGEAVDVTGAAVEMTSRGFSKSFAVNVPARLHWRAYARCRCKMLGPR